jgi:Zn-dependent M28 family amino/carboxypeptidase
MDHLSCTNTIFLSPKVVEQILGDAKQEIITKRDLLVSGADTNLHVTLPIPVSASFKINREVLAGQNVLGYIEGEKKKDELIVVSAHYDHVGKKGDEVYNGADDDASGTTGVLEIAEALATAKKMGHGPSRSVLCLLVTGEEKGLLGSEYYAANPIFPLDKTIADVNIDMIGRRGKEYQDNTVPYVYVIGSDRLSQDLHDINERINQSYSHLLFDYKYNDSEDPNRFYFRSDHYNFAKNGIPSIFFFNGVHEDYHRLSDTPDKIDLPLMEQRTRHIFHLIWDLANRKDRIRLSETQQTSP